MIKPLAQFEKEVFDAVRIREYIEMPPIIREHGISTIKLRFRVKTFPNWFVQFYYNETNGKISLVLLIDGNRVYGHDFVADKGWHRHLWPQGNHDYSIESKESVTIQEFMKKIDEILTTVIESKIKE